MLVAVTGATGHVGNNLVRALLERGDRVRVLMHDDSKPVDGLAVERVQGDVLDPASLARAFAGVERVFHLAARISIAPGDEEEVHQINVLGTRNVVAACLGVPVRRLIHFSSIHALSPEPRDRPVDETRPLAESSHLPYDRSKAAGQKEVRAGIAQGLDAIILNPTGIIGPHDYRPSPMGRVLLDLYRRRLPGLVAGGFDWVDVRDVVAGALAAADRGRAGESYVLSGAYKSVRDLAGVVEEVTGVRAPRLVSPMWLAQAGAPFITWYARLTKGKPRVTGASLHALRNHAQVSHDKATRELDYRPRPLRDTLTATYDWFKQAQTI